MEKQNYYAVFHFDGVESEKSWPEFLTGWENEMPTTSDNLQKGKWYERKEEAEAMARGLKDFDGQDWKVATLTASLPQEQYFQGATKI